MGDRIPCIAALFHRGARDGLHLARGLPLRLHLAAGSLPQVGGAHNQLDIAAHRRSGLRRGRRSRHVRAKQLYKGSLNVACAIIIAHLIPMGGVDDAGNRQHLDKGVAFQLFDHAAALGLAEVHAARRNAAHADHRAARHRSRRSRYSSFFLRRAIGRRSRRDRAARRYRRCGRAAPHGLHGIGLPCGGFLFAQLLEAVAADKARIGVGLRAVGMLALHLIPSVAAAACRIQHRADKAGIQLEPIGIAVRLLAHAGTVFRHAAIGAGGIGSLPRASQREQRQDHRQRQRQRGQPLPCLFHLLSSTACGLFPKAHQNYMLILLQNYYGVKKISVTIKGSFFLLMMANKQFRPVFA